MKSNNYEITDIGNGVWRGRLLTGYKNDKPVYKEFFALSRNSVREKLREFEKSIYINDLIPVMFKVSMTVRDETLLHLSTEHVII